MTIPRIPSYTMPTAAEFPSNRVDWQVQPSRAALLIHDMQSYFVNFFDVKKSPVSELLQNIVALRDCCRRAGIPIFYTAQPGEQSVQDRGLLTDFWGPGLNARPGEKTIVESLLPHQSDRVLVKWRYSAFQRTPLESFLQEEGRDQLIICGVYAHIGCLISACEAFMKDIQPFFVGDAVADFSKEYHHMAMNYVAQRCGVTVPNQTIVETLGLDRNKLAKDLLVVSVTRVLQKQLAELLEQPIEAIGVEDNLLDWGLDSIRLMSMVETLRRQGTEVSFTDLAEKPTISAWAQLLVSDEFTTVSIANGYFISASYDDIIKDAPTSPEPITKATETRELVQQ